MKVHDQFTLKHIDDVLRKTYSLPDENQLEFKLNNSDHEEVSVLEVKDEGVCRHYVLVNVMDEVPESEGEMPKLLEPKFVIKNHNQQSYGAFENLDGFKLVQHNHLNELKTVLVNLAEFQASALTTSPQAIKDDFLKDINPQPLNLNVPEAVKKLQSDFKRGMELKPLFVQSIWSYPSNSYVNLNSAVFLKVSHQQFLVPPLFDALLYIFALSDEKFRQKHFTDLISYYYRQLKHYMGDSETITRSYQEAVLDALLPVIKLRLAVELSKDHSARKQLQEITTNLDNYLKYPMLNQEDIYEILNNKLSSKCYDLLDYKLVALNETNGHLGEYFNLTVKLRHENEVKQFNLFAKILMSFNETFKELMEKGVGKKEDFFYNILCPMYRSYGLDDLMDFAPRCYLSNLTKVVLDDLMNMGYKPIDVNQMLDNDAVKTILSKVAKFHACSLITEEVKSRESGETVRFGFDYSEFLEEGVFLQTGKIRKFINSALVSLEFCVNQDPSLIRGLNLTQTELNDKFQQIVDGVFRKLQPSTKLRNVINHGDMYLGNILFKHHQNGTVEDGMLVDFQALRLLPPAYEVMFFVILSGNKDVHMDEVLDHYYQQLAGHLRHYNLDPEEIYSRKNFEQDVKYAKSASSIAAFHYSQLTYVDPDLRREITHDADKMKYYYEDNRIELMKLLWKNSGFKEKTLKLVTRIIDLIRDDNM